VTATKCGFTDTARVRQDGDMAAVGLPAARIDNGTDCS
jgi:hypothetical protein